MQRPRVSQPAALFPCRQRAMLTIAACFLCGCEVLHPRSKPQADATVPTSTQPATIDSTEPDERYVLTQAGGGASADPDARPARSWLTLAVVNILVPADKLSQASRVWEHVREEMLDAQLRLRLQDNGFRAG